MCCGPLAELFYRTFKETNKLTTSRKNNNDHFLMIDNLVLRLGWEGEKPWERGCDISK